MKLFLFFLAFLGTNALYGQGFLSQNSTYHTLPSEKGIKYELKVTLPYNYNETKMYSTVYYLDGFGMSDIVLGAYSLLNTYEQKIEDLIFVGISYPGDRDNWIEKRTYDLTPTKFKNMYRPAKKRSGSKVKIKYKTEKYELSENTTGGGDSFLRFIENQIIPFVNENYNNSNASRTIIGHSFGGLFAIYSLQTHPDLFENYIVIGASLSMNSSEFLEMDNFNDLDNSELKLKVFNSYGSLEPNFTKEANDTLSEILKADRFNNINYHFENYPNEGHTSVLMEAIYDGLKFIYKK